MSRIQKLVAKLGGALLLSFCSLYSNAEIVTVPIPGAPGLTVTVGTGVNALPLQNIQNNPNSVNITQGDDSWTNVPLGFDFPMYGKKFNNSWAMTNGMVTFQDPTVTGIWGACCSGINLSQTTDTRWNYSIFGLHTDLYSWNSNNQYYLRGSNEMTYGWYNVSQCCSSEGGNSFEIKINSSGLIDTRIAGALVSWNAVTSGFSGDLSKGEYFQHYHGQGLNITAGSANIFSWQALSGTGQGADLCAVDPLSSPSCPGYATAYLNQQCTISALYNPSCPGYAAAYFTQQCSLNSLYNESCPGYAQAYFNQQCSRNTLYNENCPGYAAAYLEYRCSLDPLYSTTCQGYAQAYFNQQCTLNGLYSRECPNYSTEYAKKNILEQQNTSATGTTTGPIQLAQVSKTEATPSISSDGTVKAEVSRTGDSNVDKVISSPTTTANAAAAPAAPVQLTPKQSAEPTRPVAGAPATKEEKKEQKAETKSEGSKTQTAKAEAGEKKDQPKTAREQIQEKREAAAREKAVQEGKQLAEKMGDSVSYEQQVAVQNVVIQAMGFTPGFDAYGRAMIPDNTFYKPFTIYNNQRNIDNRAASRMFGGTQKLHDEMVDAQYKREE